MTTRTLLVATATGILGFLCGALITPELDDTSRLTTAQLDAAMAHQTAQVLSRLDDLERHVDRLASLGAVNAEPVELRPLAAELPGDLAARLDRLERRLDELPQWAAQLADPGLGAEARKPIDTPRVQAALGLFPTASTGSSATSALNAEVFGLSPAAVYARFGQPSHVVSRPDHSQADMAWQYFDQSAGKIRVLEVLFTGGMATQIWRRQ